MATAKPRSMQSGQRNQIRSNDSLSLWNCTIAPGWQREEVDILVLALQKFGMNSWQKIIDARCLPGKTIAQMNLQTQRMVGQQSIAEFTGLHIDPIRVGEANSKLQGPEIKRKNNFIVNQGGKLTREEINRRRQENTRLYGISPEEYNSIVLPTPLEEEVAPAKDPDTIRLLESKRAELKKLEDELENVSELIEQMQGSEPSTSEPSTSRSTKNSTQKAAQTVSPPPAAETSDAGNQPKKARRR